MSAYDWFAVGAVLALLLLIGWHCAGPRTPTDQAAWSASTGVRTEADVQADLAVAKEARQLVEQVAYDLAFARIVAAENTTSKTDIPHQTRRTEEDQ